MGIPKTYPHTTRPQETEERPVWHNIGVILAAIVSLLSSALLLLQLVAANPNLPQSFRDTATSVAQSAIAEATRALATAQTTPTTPTIPTTPTTPNAICTTAKVKTSCLAGEQVTGYGECGGVICSPITPQPTTSCTFNGQAVAHGQTVTAYQSASVPAGQSCVSQQRTCTNGVLSGAYTNASCAPQVAVNHHGWDYDLAKKCVRTTGSSDDANYFALADQCGGDGKRWTIAVQSENAPGASAPGPANRSFLINGPESPVTMGWHQHQSELGSNWSVNMKSDFITQPHPTGDGYFTWFAFMDHADQGGGPFPLPQQLVSEHRIGYNSHVPFADGATRLIAGAQFYYGGKAHLIEINLAETQWGDGHADPEVVILQSDWLGDGTLEYITLDGAALGYTITPTVEATIRIPWGDILDYVIAKGWFSPIGNQSSATQAVFIATETKNKVVTDLWHTNFRVSSE